MIEPAARFQTHAVRRPPGVAGPAGQGAERVTSAQARPRRGAVLAVACLGSFMTFVDTTIVSIAFPAIHSSFATTPLSTLSWVFNGYNVVFAAFLVPP